MARPAFTIFGGTGDLTFRKLLPALYNLSATGVLPESHLILIIGRRDYTTQQYLALARDWVEQFSRIPYREADFLRFANQVEYFKMDFTALEQYSALNTYFQEKGVERSIFYFAVAPRFFSVITEGLSGVTQASAGKVILEKPFGETLEAAEQLNRRLEAFFPADHIYRIDHYLGKEMVRNLQAIRFANPIFSDAWDEKHVECIQISALEDVGVETRGGYYDASGALRDMVQNHLFQILSILAMEQPGDFAPEAMHDEQLKVLRALRLPEPGEIGRALVLGQYAGYREEKSVAADSLTETYAALRLTIDNARWKQTPFYIRTGKKLGKRQMEVTVQFRRPSSEVAPCILNVKIQPTEGVYLQFNIKRPGDFEEIIPTKMDFCQSCVLEHRINTPEAYERLLLACMRGERSWFSQWDQIETSWRFIDSLRDLYFAAGLTPFAYEPGERGPEQANGLLAQQGHAWIEEDPI